MLLDNNLWAAAVTAYNFPVLILLYFLVCILLILYSGCFQGWVKDLALFYPSLHHLLGAIVNQCSKQNRAIF